MNLRDKTWDHFLGSVTVDKYLAAIAADAEPDLLKEIENEVIGTQLKGKIYIYHGDEKTTLTLHPPSRK